MERAGGPADDGQAGERAITPGRVLAGGALLGALIVVAVLLLAPADDYTVRARFQTAGQLVKGNLVQTAGRKVGTVQDIRLAPDGYAEVDLKVEGDLAPLREGTQAEIRIASLSGVANRYVDLRLPPGEAQETIPDGGVIPVHDTTTAVDLDQLFALFDERTRKGLKNVIRGFAASYAGKSDEASAGWEYLNPSLMASRRLFSELVRDRRALESFVVENAQLVSDISERRDDVVLLVDRLATTLDAIGREKQALSGAIAQLPDFMRRANTTFVNLRATLDDLDPLLDESRPVTPKLRAVLAELAPFARDASPTFRNLSRLVARPGEHNDLIELGRSVLPLRDITIRGGRFNGEQREGSFKAGTRSLRAQTPQFAFQRPYAVDLTGWFDDFSHSGIYDAFGSASRVATSVSAFAFANGTLQPVPEELRAAVLQQAATLDQRNRCPGSAERPADDGANPYKPSPDFNCDPSQIPPGK